MAHLRVIVANLVLVLGLPIGPGFAQQDSEKITPDWIEKAYERGVKCLAGGDDAGAESAFLQSLYLIERHFEGKHKTARPYLRFADLLIEHREVFHALICVERALGCPDYPHEDADRNRFISELFVLACNPAIERSKSAAEVYGEKLPLELPARLKEALISLRAPGAKDAKAARTLVDFVAKAATQRMEQKRSLVTALALVAAGLERLGADLESEPPADLRRPVERLRDLFRRCFREARESCVGDSVGENRVIDGRSPALAYRLGEIYRLRWRVDRDREDFARMAAKLFTFVLDARADHRAAARGLAEIQFRTGDKPAAAETIQDLVGRLLAPSVAWVGPPRLPPAPRIYLASTMVEAFDGDAVGLRPLGKESDPVVVELGRAVHDRILDSYLEYRRFHPFDRVVCWGDVEVSQENNAGFQLMQRWELKRAEQHLRRCLHLAEHVAKPRESAPVAYQNLGHIYYLQGDLDRAVEYYRKSFEQDSSNAVAANNLGAVMGIFGSITLDLHLIHEGLEYYKRAVELAPDYAYAKHSKAFMEKVYITWDRYLHRKDRTVSRVGSFGNSFLFAAKSISEGADPRYLQAMQILDAGIRAMPGEDELERLFGPKKVQAEATVGTVDPHGILERMRSLFDRCRKAAVKKYLGRLRERCADHPALNFMLGETRRVAWRRSGLAWDRDRAIKCYETTLATEPGHAGAAAGLAEMLRSMGKDTAAMAMLDGVIAELLKPVRPWPGEPEVIAHPRTRRAFRLAVRVAKEGGMEGQWGAFLRRTMVRLLEAQTAHARTLPTRGAAEAWNNAGYFELKAAELLDEPERRERALGHFDEALGLIPDSAEAALNKILALRRLGRHEEAEALRAAMEDKHPDDPRFRPALKRKRL